MRNRRVETVAAPTPAPALPAILTEAEASAYLRITQKSLQQWRWLRRGPRYFKHGNRVRYRLRDLDDYIAANTIEPAARERGRRPSAA
jgi:hypothetical protein